MKHIKHWLATMAMLLCSVAAGAHEFEVGGIYYNITSEENLTVEVTYWGYHPSSYNEYIGTFSIPETVTYNNRTYCVSTIGTGAFSYCNDLTSITIPKSVTSIGEQAFYLCKGLTSITIPESVTSIGHGAFESASWYINQPDGVIYINNVLYEYKGEMPENTSIVVREGTISISPFAFSRGSTFASISIPESVTLIGDYAFVDCTGKLTVNCNTIGKAVFSDNDFSEVVIGENVRNIGDNAFMNCNGLKYLTILEGVTNIGNNAFTGCCNLVTIYIPKSITNIGKHAFNGCTGELIINCNIPSGDGYNDGIFDLSEFSKVTIGEDVTSIGDYAFCHRTSITSLGLPKYVSIGDYAFYKCSSITSLELPQHVSVGDYAFYGCNGLESITIPENVRHLGIQALANCGGKLVVNCDIPSAAASSQGVFYDGLFTEVIIGDKVKSIGDYAFEKCTAMKSLTLPESLETIGDYAFNCCVSLNSLTIPESVVSIGDYAFYCCTLIAKITCHSTIPPTCGANTFAGLSPYYTSLEIPLGSEVLYRSAEGWKNLFINTNGGEGDAGEKDEVEAVTGITLSQDEVTLVEGERFTLTATVLPSNATDQAVTWSSSKESVATVTNGVVTAKSTGVAIITAKVSDKEATCVVTVEKDVIAVTNIILSQEEATLAEGETLVLTATVLPSNATDKTVTWSSSKESVATVMNGVVTAIAPGTTVITAKAGDKEAICVVMVIAASGVDGMMADEEEAVIYDLSGRRVLNPTKGVYVINGKKVVIK